MHLFRSPCTPLLLYIQDIQGNGPCMSYVDRACAARCWIRFASHLLVHWWKSCADNEGRQGFHGETGLISTATFCSSHLPLPRYVLENLCCMVDGTCAMFPVFAQGVLPTLFEACLQTSADTLGGHVWCIQGFIWILMLLGIRFRIFPCGHLTAQAKKKASKFFDQIFGLPKAGTVDCSRTQLLSWEADLSKLWL